MSGVDLFLPKTRTTREARARALEDAADVLASDTPPADALGAKVWMRGGTRTAEWLRERAKQERSRR